MSLNMHYKNACLKNDKMETCGKVVNCFSDFKIY